MGKQVFRGDTTLTSVTLPAKLWELLCICPFIDEPLQTGLESIQKQYLEGLKESSVPSVRRGLGSEGPAQWLETPALRPRSSPHRRESLRDRMSGLDPHPEKGPSFLNFEIKHSQFYSSSPKSIHNMLFLQCSPWYNGFIISSFFYSFFYFFLYSSIED